MTLHRSLPLSTGMAAMLLLNCTLIGGCISIQPVSTPTPQPATASPTATVSFPTPMPTSTQTPPPIPTSTPDTLNALGAMLYHETFDQAEDWQFSKSESGGASIFNGRLTLAVRKADTMYFVRSPAPDLSDFYLEVAVRSELCTDDDEFGVMFRTNSLGEHYRYALTCDGKARVTRVLQGGETALVPLTETYAVIPGMMVENRLGVLAFQNNMRFYINNIEVFTVRDSTLQHGGVSLFVRSRRNGQTTASFESISARALRAQPPVTDTVTPVTP